MTTRLVQPFMNFLPKALAEGKYGCASGPWIVERSLEFIRALKIFVFSGGGHYNLKLVFGYSLNISRFQGVITAFPMYLPWLYPSPARIRIQLYRSRGVQSRSRESSCTRILRSVIISSGG